MAPQGDVKVEAAPPPASSPMAPGAAAPASSGTSNETAPKVATAAPSALDATSSAPATSAVPAPPSAREGFAVQLAAFADDKGANALAIRLARAGYTTYTEPLKTSKGTLWRVRVG